VIDQMQQVIEQLDGQKVAVTGVIGAATWIIVSSVLKMLWRAIRGKPEPQVIGELAQAVINRLRNGTWAFSKNAPESNIRSNSETNCMAVMISGCETGKVLIGSLDWTTNSKLPEFGKFEKRFILSELDAVLARLRKEKMMEQVATINQFKSV
jgi:hypothetical protein